MSSVHSPVPSVSPDSSQNLGRVRVASVGFAAGLLNGLIGIGGGLVIVPALILHGRASPQVAVGSSLTAMVVFSSVAFAAHLSFADLGATAWQLVLALGAGVAGARFGAWILTGLTTRWMLLLFAALVLLMSTRLLIQGLGLFGVAESLVQTPPTWAYASIAFAAGILSGVFGIGGGGLVLLGLAVFFGLPVREGIPLALAVNIGNALSGCVHHARAGRVLWWEVARMMPLAAIGIAVGTVLAIWLPPAELRIVFSTFFLFMAIRIARQGLTQ